jgi:predicted phosphate transport protein (TIGR00153 family)
VSFQAIPRERGFFDLLERAADGVVAAAREFRTLAEDLARAEELRGRIRELEHQGDDLTHQVMALLDTTFVVPVDRHDIHLLASSLDDVLDAIEAVTDLLVLYRVEEPIPHFRPLADVLAAATEAVSRGVHGLRSMRAMERVWVDIVRLERDGDHVYRRAVAALYAGDYGAMDVLKWKDILENMEQAIDRCQDIANTIESIALKYA